jgi:hypothetical protein
MNRLAHLLDSLLVRRPAETIQTGRHWRRGALRRSGHLLSMLCKLTARLCSCSARGPLRVQHNSRIRHQDGTAPNSTQGDALPCRAAHQAGYKSGHIAFYAARGSRKRAWLKGRLGNHSESQSPATQLQSR